MLENLGIFSTFGEQKLVGKAEFPMIFEVLNDFRQPFQAGLKLLDFFRRFLLFLEKNGFFYRQTLGFLQKSLVVGETNQYLSLPLVLNKNLLSLHLVIEGGVILVNFCEGI